MAQAQPCNEDCFNCFYPDCIFDGLTVKICGELREIESNLIFPKIWKERQTAKRKKVYRQAHKEEIAAYQKKYHQVHKEEIAAWQKAYRQSHKEEIAAWKKAYRQAHKEEIPAHQKKYRQARKEGAPCRKN